MISYLAVAVISAATLAYEVLLVRLFAIVQWHHFAFMAISIALLGFGASGTWLALWQRWAGSRFTPIFAASATLFALSAPASFLAAQALPFNALAIVWDPGQLLYLLAMYLLLVVPFFCGATCVGLAFVCYGDKVERLYAFNLIGSAVGALGIVAVLFVLSPSDALRLIAALGFIATGLVVLDRRLVFWPALSAGGAILALAGFRPVFPDLVRRHLLSCSWSRFPVHRNRLHPEVHPVSGSSPVCGCRRLGGLPSVRRYRERHVIVVCRTHRRLAQGASTSRPAAFRDPTFHHRHHRRLAALPLDLAHPIRFAAIPYRHRQDSGLARPDRSTGLLHGHAVSAWTVARVVASPAARSLGLGRERLRLGPRCHTRRPDCHDIGLFVGRGGRNPPLRGCCNDLAATSWGCGITIEQWQRPPSRR